jgi:FkbM family methyltransferase
MPLKALFYPDVPFESLYVPHIFKEVYLDKVYDEVVAGRNDLVMIDVGANIGLVAHFLRNYSRVVYCLEPSTQHFEALSMNKEYNEWDNVELFQMALSHSDGEADFGLNSSNRTMNSLVWGGDSSQTVKTCRLDTFFADNEIEYVDFVKMDVEGAEGMILASEGFANVVDKIGAIEIEFHSGDWLQWVDFFLKRGFVWKQYPTEATVILFTRS